MAERLFMFYSGFSFTMVAFSKIKKNINKTCYQLLTVSQFIRENWLLSTPISLNVQTPQ